jgi:hypothetical protein
MNPQETLAQPEAESFINLHLDSTNYGNNNPEKSYFPLQLSGRL